MKKALKAFTLIELIVVMAILVILMSAIMNMFKPIRETYVDATLYEAQRTTQNGIVQYMTESIRYATDLGIYTKNINGVKNVTDAVEHFNKKYLEANGIDPDDHANSTKVSDTLELIKRNAEVIIIDYSNNYKYNGVDYTGRILRRKFEKENVGGVNVNKELTVDAENPNMKNACRLALGDAYYGASDYTISLGVTQDATTKIGDPEMGIKVTVASYTGAYANRDNDANNSGGINGVAVSNSNLVMCRNLMAPIKGMFDTVDFDPVASTTAGGKVYIVYLNEEIDVA